MTTSFRFNNLGYLMSDISDELSAMLNGEVEYIQNNFKSATPYNQYLAGHIKHEYELVSSVKMLEDFVLPLTQEYDRSFDYNSSVNILTDDLPMCVKNAWVNFQSKGEFNPTHNHAGVYSFVIWLKIPYDIKEEFKVFRHVNDKEDKIPMTSAFQFVYVNTIGQTATQHIHVDKSFENKLILFPSKLMHCVYPFYTSDDYRISVAGNVSIRAK